jgi:hypothetical protein
MTPKSKSRSGQLLLAVAVLLAIFLLLLRLFSYTHRHRRLGFLGIANNTSVALAASHPQDQASSSRLNNPRSPAWTDRFQDGTPDFLRLTDPADQAAFREWFTQIATYQSVRPKAEVPAEIADCASLLRYAYREALKRHNDTWFLATGIEVSPLPGEIRSWYYPETPLGAGLFRVRPGSFEPADAANGAFAQFADAKTLVERNAYFVSRDVSQAQLGDLLFYRQFGQSSPWHSMVVTRFGHDPGVVYHTGPDHGKAGELRRVLLSELLDHPQPQWRPIPSNPNFLGVYRWNILRGTL